MKRSYKIAAIVEGRGEQGNEDEPGAVSVLLRRWFNFRHFHNLETEDQSIRAPVSALKHSYDPKARLGIEHYIETALRTMHPDGIIVIFDADDDCPKDLAPLLLARAKATYPHVPIGIVMANREYEAWMLGMLPKLRQMGKLKRGARKKSYPYSVEKIRDCKGELSRLLPFTYRPTLHQAEFSGYLPFSPAMRRKSRSFRKLLDTLERLAKEVRVR